MDAIRIRTATFADVPAVLALWARGAKGASITDDPDGVARLIGRDPEALLLAVERGDGEPERVVGSVIAGWDGWRCHLYRLAVDPDRRRRGIGSALLRAAEDRFVALGGRRGDAMVLDANETAHRIWATAGYAPNEEWTRWTKPLPAAGTAAPATEG
ncbi:ribosomal protein S18 acetylase RimI-like enzyme [Allostreptomyces psammosilenae]|uniref:Ribosomal protein S18 acetylase RimI-like enzyme n=1 Tax=Allostreptomyces psammosilenae TaxID=1892865 RepID=A0A852ZTJ5_9ACTN|nr:ribosomal protein S18 acetylase RimI-like enzyme [Allostreptomyces psammosilenae]